MFKILGYCEKKGQFSSKDDATKMIDYHKYCFSFFTDLNPDFADKGYATSWNGINSFDISAKELETVTGKKNPSELVGREVKPEFLPCYGRVKLASLAIIK